MEDFKTPPDHVAFLAKKIFGDCGRIIDGSIAYVEPGGGGPEHPHTHEHSHLFIVMVGEAVIRTPDQDILLKANESYLVDGSTEHSVWNVSEGTTVMVGISVMPESI